MNHATTNTLLLRNARLIVPSKIAESASLLIEDDRIGRILNAHSAESIKANSKIDLDGLTLFPGFIDVHIHGAVGVDVMDASVEKLRCVSGFLASQGVTGWLPTLVPASAEEYERAVQAIQVAQTSVCDIDRRLEYRLQSGDEREKDPTKVGTLNTCSARILGVHYEGPFVNSEQCGALHREYFRTFKGLADLDTLPTINHENAIHFMTLAPEIEGAIELIRELRKHGWIVSIGHTRADVDVLDRAYEAGARHLTHFMNAMTPLHHRAPGPVGWGLSRDDVTCDVIADGIHLDRFMLLLLLKLKTPERLSLISDAIAATGMGDGDYKIWGETISVKDSRTRNARGSIAGSVITMLDAVRMMLSLGVAELDVARMASTNPARLLRIDQDYGSIEEGKRADLVAVDSSGQVRLTLVGGRVAHDTRHL